VRVQILDVIYFIALGLAVAPAAVRAREGGRPTIFGTIALAAMGFVGYNSRWAQSQSPGLLPLGIAVVAGVCVWAGLRLDVPGRLFPGRFRGAGEPEGSSAGARTTEAASSVPVASPGFGDLSLREVMTPKAMIAGVDASATAADAVRVARSSGHSRLIVYEDDLDHIAGVVNIHGLLESPGGVAGLRRLVRPALFVPESKKCFGMLEEFLREREQFAVALDEFGGTAGVVTVEDLLDELVGEMADEHDRGEAPLRRMSDGSYLVPGHMKIDDVNERLGIGLPEGDYETISGLVLEELGRVPARGERLEARGATLEVAVSTARRIVTVKVTARSGGAGAGGDD
jgi:Mg2+/Co2+ transporter CorC